MREIRFRSWDTKMKVMHYHESFYLPKLPHCITMQYTGWEDREKNRIYDGDIFRTDHKKWGHDHVRYYSVVMNKYGAFLKSHPNSPVLNPTRHQEPRKVTLFELTQVGMVVGNLYEDVDFWNQLTADDFTHEDWEKKHIYGWYIGQKGIPEWRRLYDDNNQLIPN